MNVQPLIVWFIDDSKQSAEEYSALLGQTEAFEFVYLPPRPSIDDYGDIIAHSRTGVIIIDQKLSPESGVSYSGLQLADYLRLLRPNLPLYILTSVTKDIEHVESEGQSVESVIRKGAVRTSSEVYVARLARSAKRYEESLNEMQMRLKELIDKLDNGLDETEQQELEALQDYFERPHRLPTEMRIKEREADLQDRRAVVSDLQQLLDKIERLDNN